MSESDSMIPSTLAQSDQSARSGRSGASSTGVDVTTSPFLVVNGDVPLAVRVYRRPGDPFERQPAVIITGSWLTVKEQMAHHYAVAMAARGYTAFTFDFAGLGESGGALRQAEIPARRIADIKEMARYVSTLSYVRPGGVGYLAICATAQYALAAIAEGADVRSFASVAGWYHDMATVASFYGGSEGMALRLGRARDALEHYRRTGEVVTVPAYHEGNDRAGMFRQLDYYANPARGAIPEWNNRMAEMSWAYFLTFDGLSAAPSVEVPTLFVHSDDCVLPDNLKHVRDTAGGRTETVWAEGTQIDFYDDPEHMALAVDAVDKHFNSTLQGA